MSRPHGLRVRPTARVILVDGEGRLLLFRYAHTRGPLAGQVFWTPPGGGVDEGESFAQAAIREVEEETGLLVDDVGPEIARREFELQLPDGELVWLDERIFLVRIGAVELSRDGWTELEREVMVDHRWWTMDELAAPEEQVWPEDLPRLIADALPLDKST